MYVGLIIVFNTFDNERLKEDFISVINTMQHAKICLVCNSNSDQDFEILSEIAEQCHSANVVNTKRKKSNTTAVRAGARYMFNQFNLKHLGFIVDDDRWELLEVIKDYAQHQEAIVALNTLEKRKKAFKQTFFQSLFSVPDYLSKIA